MSQGKLIIGNQIEFNEFLKLYKSIDDRYIILSSDPYTEKIQSLKFNNLTDFNDFLFNLVFYKDEIGDYTYDEYSLQHAIFCIHNMPNFTDRKLYDSLVDIIYNDYIISNLFKFFYNVNNLKIPQKILSKVNDIIIYKKLTSSEKDILKNNPKFKYKNIIYLTRGQEQTNKKIIKKQVTPFEYNRTSFDTKDKYLQPYIDKINEQNFNTVYNTFDDSLKSTMFYNDYDGFKNIIKSLRQGIGPFSTEVINHYSLFYITIWKSAHTTANSKETLKDDLLQNFYNINNNEKYYDSLELNQSIKYCLKYIKQNEPKFDINKFSDIKWLDTDTIGDYLFTFDGKTIYNLFADYPYELTEEELNIFNREEPYWSNFFRDRLREIDKLKNGDYDYIIVSKDRRVPPELKGLNYKIISLKLFITLSNSAEGLIIDNDLYYNIDSLTKEIYERLQDFNEHITFYKFDDQNINLNFLIQKLTVYSSCIYTSFKDTNNDTNTDINIPIDNKDKAYTIVSKDKRIPEDIKNSTIFPLSVEQFIAKANSDKGVEIERDGLYFNIDSLTKDLYDSIIKSLGDLPIVFYKFEDQDIELDFEVKDLKIYKSDKKIKNNNNTVDNTKNKDTKENNEVYLGDDYIIVSKDKRIPPDLKYKQYHLMSLNSFVEFSSSPEGLPVNNGIFYNIDSLNKDIYDTFKYLQDSFVTFYKFDDQDIKLDFQIKNLKIYKSKYSLRKKDDIIKKEESYKIEITDDMSENEKKRVGLINEILSTDSTEADKELCELLKQYENKFGEYVPTAFIPGYITNEALKDAIKECLEKNVDILSLLNIKIDYDMLY